MVRIVAEASVYNGAQFLPTALYGIHKYIDKLVVIDGAFAGLLASGYFKTAHSTDGTKEVLESLDLDCRITWISAPEKGWESHSHKRAAFFEHLEDGDWEYILNDDEIMIGEIETTFEELRHEKKAKAIYFRFVDLCGSLASIRFEKNGIHGHVPRFFKWENENKLFYGYTHIELANSQGVNFRSWKDMGLARFIEECQLIHLKRFRPAFQILRSLSDGDLYDTHVRGSRKIALAV